MSDRSVALVASAKLLSRLLADVRLPELLTNCRQTILRSKDEQALGLH